MFSGAYFLPGEREAEKKREKIKNPFPPFSLLLITATSQGFKRIYFNMLWASQGNVVQCWWWHEGIYTKDKEEKFSHYKSLKWVSWQFFIILKGLRLCL